MEATAVATRVGIAQHAKIDEEHDAGEGLDQMMSDRHRNRGFADAARPTMVTKREAVS